MFAQGPGAFAVTLVAHRCIYRPSPAMDDFRAVLLLQPGLMCRHCHGAPALVVFMNTRLCWGCSSSIRASAVVAHKAGTENLPCPLIVHFPWGHLCRGLVWKEQRLWPACRAAGVEHCAGS